MVSGGEGADGGAADREAGRHDRAGGQPEEGLGSPEFQQVLAENPDLAAFKKRIIGADYFVMDQWQVEEMCKVLERCRVKVVSDGLSAETLRLCHVEAAATVEQAVAESLEEYGPRRSVAVIPKGPYVLPYVA